MKDGAICALADDRRSSRNTCSRCWKIRNAAAELASRARAEVEANWDMAAITRKLVEGYRELARAKRSASNGLPGGAADAL